MTKRYRMVQSGERKAGTWSIFDMDTLTVARVRGRPLEGMDETTAARAFEVLTGEPPMGMTGAPSVASRAEPRSSTE